MELFETNLPPLAERVRPRKLEEVIGQEELLGPAGPLRQLIAQGQLPSMILWGPPGVGKTTLARLLAGALQRPLETLSAVQSGVKDVRQVIERAGRRAGTVLFIDEIHRFNKAQQDALLHAVESGRLTLIGATTENPSFEVINALLSRAQVYVLQALGPAEIEQVLRRAIARDELLQQREIRLESIQALYRIAGGDARKALNILEMLVAGTPREQPVLVTDEQVMAVTRQNIARYDKAGEQHYDIISAFIKSVRGGDPNAAVYWLGLMLQGGEDIRFIARRLVILASEDIGNANPNALLLANAGFEAANKIGLPEARIILSQVTTYLACSPKSNAAYAAINAAMAHLQQEGAQPVPLHLRNAPTDLMKDLGYSAGYKYSHAYEAADPDALQDYLPEALRGTVFYQPKPIGSEEKLLRFLQNKWGNWYGYSSTFSGEKEE
mgnify:CR=1 FL=1